MALLRSPSSAPLLLPFVLLGVLALPFGVVSGLSVGLQLRGREKSRDTNTKKAARQSPAGLPGPPPPTPEPTPPAPPKREPIRLHAPIEVHFRLVNTSDPIRSDESYTDQPLIDLPPVAVIEAQAEELPGEESLYQQLDRITGTKTTGMIIPRGAALPDDANSEQMPDLVTAMNFLSSDPNTKTICESGFNAGHGSLRWLEHSAFRQAKVFSFDLGGVHPYGPKAAEFLAAQFPGRLLVTWGDSRVTVPTFAQQHPEVKCDIIYLDGGHDPGVAMADLKNFMLMANPSHNIVLIDDTPCSSAFCQGPYMAWQEMVQAGLILPLNTVMMDGGKRGYSVGKYQFPPPGVAVTMPPTPAFSAR